MVRKLSAVLVLCSLGGLLSTSQSVFGRPEFQSIQERAQGQSLSGATLLNDSLYTNPATSAFTNVYVVEGLFAAPRSFAVSILDTKTSAVGGGVGYFRETGAAGTIPLQGAKLSLMGRANEWIGVGVAGKSVWGRDVTDTMDTRMNDGDAGVIARFSIVQLGLAARNLLGGKPDLGFDRHWLAGARFSYEDMMYLSASAETPWGSFTPRSYGIGAEYVSPYYFALKGGYTYLPQERSGRWGAGASILSPKLSVHYAVEFPEDGRPDSVMEHTLGAAFSL